MAVQAGDKPMFLIKKLGGLVLLLFGVLLAAVGSNYGSTWLTVLGILLLAGGMVLLALKVLRRNQDI